MRFSKKNCFRLLILNRAPTVALWLSDTTNYQHYGSEFVIQLAWDISHLLSTPKLNLDNKAAKMNLELKSPSRKRLPTSYNRLQTAKHARSSNVIRSEREIKQENETGERSTRENTRFWWALRDHYINSHISSLKTVLSSTMSSPQTLRCGHKVAPRAIIKYGSW